jgi:hypothetical protein
VKQLWLLVVLVSACGGGGTGSSSSVMTKPSKRPTTTKPAIDKTADQDHDGVCDATEQQVGTDPKSADTDGDGFPDLIELGNGFHPTDPSSPAPDQVAYLEARSGATLDFSLRATVDGDGQGVSGLFQTISSIYGDATTAEDFFTGAEAVSADPVDGVRNIDASSARFDSVLGRTRLVFSLHFEYMGASKTCARAYPFRYGMKSDDGQTSGERLYLLVLAPQGQMGHDIKYCLPTDCQ